MGSSASMRIMHQCIAVVCARPAVALSKEIRRYSCHSCSKPFPRPNLIITTTTVINLWSKWWMTAFVLIKLYSRSHSQTKKEMKGRQRCKNVSLKWSFKLLVATKQSLPRWYSPLATTTIPSDSLRREPQPVEHILQRCTDGLILVEALLPTYTRTRTYDR